MEEDESRPALNLVEESDVPALKTSGKSPGREGPRGYGGNVRKRNPSSEQTGDAGEGGEARRSSEGRFLSRGDTKLHREGTCERGNDSDVGTLEWRKRWNRPKPQLQRWQSDDLAITQTQSSGVGSRGGSERGMNKEQSQLHKWQSQVSLRNIQGTETHSLRKRVGSGRFGRQGRSNGACNEDQFKLNDEAYVQARSSRQRQISQSEFDGSAPSNAGHVTFTETKPAWGDSRGRGGGRAGRFRGGRGGMIGHLVRGSYTTHGINLVEESKGGKRGRGQEFGRGGGRVGGFGRRGGRRGDGGRGVCGERWNISNVEQRKEVCTDTQSLISKGASRGDGKRVGGVGRGLEREQTWHGSDFPRKANTTKMQSQSWQAKAKGHINRPMDYNKLLSIASMGSSEEVAMELTSSRNGLSVILNVENMKTDWFILILQAIEKACHAVHRESIFRVLTLVCSSHFIERHLMRFLAGAVIPPFSSNTADHLKRVLFLIEEIVQRLPSNSEKCVPCLVMMKKVIEVQQLSIYPELDSRREDLLMSCQQAAIQRDLFNALSSRQSKKGVRSADEESPPEDFRTVGVFPSLEEFNKSVHVFLRQNKTEGAYASLDNYLDVHFRLLREDYMQPLRKGIVEYKQCVQRGESPSKMADLNMYYGVHIIGTVCSEEVETRLKFDTAKTKKINWQASKRLIYGSLVCLSPDDFETMFYATVANRDVKDLSKGIIQVKVHKCLEYLLKFSTSDTFVMAETTAYFEAYKHVLYRLQEIPETMPFQKYLVECKTDIAPPEYILTQQGIVYYNLQALGSSVQLNRVPVLNTLRWPNVSEFRLDASQLAAVKTALSKELVVIQGPPGTGKTHVGLQIAQVLLFHKHVWSRTGEDSTKLDIDVQSVRSEENPGLILVVCYTNHALDQFLEGIAKFEKGIVRVGGRSKSEEMKKFNLKELRQKQRHDREVRQSIFDNELDCKKEMSSLKLDIEEVTAKIEACSLGILRENKLRHIIDDGHYTSLLDRQRANSKVSAIQEWLGFGELQTAFSGTAKSKEELIAKWETIILQNIKYPMQKPPPRGTDEKKVLHIDLEERVQLYCGWIATFRYYVTNELRQMSSTPRFDDEYTARRELYFYLLKLSKTHILMDELIQPVVPEYVFSVITNGYHAKVQDGCAIRAWLGVFHSVFEEGILKAMELLQIEEVNSDDDAETEEDEDDDDVFGVSSNRFVDDKDDIFNTDSRDSRRLLNEAMAGVTVNFVTLQTVTADEQREYHIDKGWEIQPHQLKQFKRNLQSLLKSKRCMDERQVLSVRDVWQLNSDSRADLYRYWIQKYQSKLRESVIKKEEKYQCVANRIKEVRLEKDKAILKDAAVIGMTTTGAAKNAQLLQVLAPKIIIVEEAAEVLESHIITTLSPSCQHLILIGDHQQLRPNPTVYELAKLYNFDTSLFERLINNNIHHVTLRLQHRMRPEVALLMKHIYPNLENHDSVTKYPHVKGVSKDVFFVHHEKQEAEQHETKSKSNEYEAAFIVALCRYFLHQGYKPEEVTILAPYTGQILLIKSHMHSIPDGVRLTSVDNFQGEECRIILLSLVRSNERGSVGFLGIDNRICVALSRAKEGLFAVGNMKLLSEKSSLWKKIVATLDDTQCLGPSLKLQCQNHPEETIDASEAKDFEKAPEGSCTKPCKTRLSCGHVCERICHIEDQEHMEYICRKSCQRSLPNCEHSCPQKCFKKCRPCEVKVQKVIPTCGHTDVVTCSVEPAFWKCQLDCEKILPCGHRCEGQCGRCMKSGGHLKCNVSVEKIFPCGHIAETCCYESKEAVPCPQPCQAILNCGHKCSGSCGRCWQNGDHMKCNVSVDKVLTCGHKAKICCCKSKETLSCPQPCKANLDCGHQCSGFCGRCSQSDDHMGCSVPVEKVFPCGHRASIVCSKSVELFSCSQPCGATLNCGHKCTGSCRKCFKGKTHERCTNPCRKTLPCSHHCQKLCNVPCEPCEACTENYKRVHSYTQGRMLFSKPRSKPCPHKSFYGFSNDMEPCDELCGRVLSCGHICCASCGEDCVCLECQNNDVHGPEACIGWSGFGHIFNKAYLDVWMTAAKNTYISNKQLSSKAKHRSKSQRGKGHGSPQKPRRFSKSAWK